jgi:lipopolysaccharide export system protein LptA
VTLYRRPDGTLSRIEAHGNVTGEGDGTSVVSQKADIALTATSQPQTAVLTGGVKYVSDGSLRQIQGESDAATVEFDGHAKPQPAHALFAGAVHLTQRKRATAAAKEPWSTSNLTASRLEVALAPGAQGKAEVRDADASGSPHLTMVNGGSLANSSGAGTTDLSADELKAHLIASGDPKQKPQLDAIVGRGHTVLRQISVDGVEQMSAGDTLDVKMRPGVVKNASAGGSETQGVDTLASAVQTGHVTMMRRLPARPAKNGAKTARQEEVQHASAQRAVFDGDRDDVTLSGGVTMNDADSGLSADQVVMDRRTGDAHAVGAVKVNYVQDTDAAKRPGQQPEPTYILADRAELEHATQVGTFYGKPVRLWQGGNQVQAPEIEFARETERMIARGGDTTGWSQAAQAAQVRTVLASGQSEVSGTSVPGGPKRGAAQGCTASAKAAGGKTGADAEAKSTNVVRIASGGLIYSGILRQADFTGGFRADTADGTIRAGAGTVYMQKGTAETAIDASGPSLGGKLDRMVATGHVELDKPGMRATGERLVYTASDRMVLLTGDAKSPPRAVGSQGTTTGAALRFNSCDGSVEALGAEGQHVLTDALVGNEEKKDKGKR